MGSLKVFSGRSNRPLAERIAADIGEPLGQCEIRTFSDGEIWAKYSENVRGCDVFIIQSTNPPAENLLELLIMIDAAKRSSARKVAAVIPYFGYARQDRKDQPRVSITAKLVANLLTKAGADRIITMDLHAPQIQGFFDIPVDHLYSSAVLVKYFTRKKIGNLAVASPDVGGIKMARAYAKRLEADLIVIDKRRPRQNEAEVMNIIGEVEGRNIIIVDDLVDTAGTLVNAVAALKNAGAHDVYAACDASRAVRRRGRQDQRVAAQEDRRHRHAPAARGHAADRGGIGRPACSRKRSRGHSRICRSARCSTWTKDNLYATQGAPCLQKSFSMPNSAARRRSTRSIPATRGWSPASTTHAASRTLNIQVQALVLNPLVFTSETHVIDLRLSDGSSKKCILRDVQFDPVSDRPVHFDLQGLKENEKLTMDIPIVLPGGIPKGVRDGGMLQHVIHKVKISCLPKDMPEKIEVNVADLGINDLVHVSDLSVPNVVDSRQRREHGRRRHPAGGREGRGARRRRRRRGLEGARGGRQGQEGRGGRGRREAPRKAKEKKEK